MAAFSVASVELQQGWLSCQIVVSTKAIESFDLELRVDPLALQPVSAPVSISGPAAGWLTLAREAAPGQWIVGGFTTTETPVAPGQVLLTLSFLLADPARPALTLQLGGGINHPTQPIGLLQFDLTAQTNQPPTSFDGQGSTMEDLPWTGQLPTATDADGDSIVYAKVTDPGRGSVTVGVDGSYTYVPNPDQFGSDSFTFSVSDGNGGSTIYTQSLTIAAVNDAPVATPGQAFGAEDAEIRGAVQVIDVDGDAFTFAVVTGPSHGELSILADGSYAYVPDADYHGTDSFTFKANDGTVDSGPATITLTIAAVNDAPVSSGTTQYTRTGSTLKGNLPAASDVDGDAVTYAVGTEPARGSVTIAPDGSFSYVTPSGLNEPDTFRFSVSDGQGGSSGYLVTLYPESWLGIARIANAWFNGTFGNGTMTALASAVEQIFVGDPVLFAAEVYRQYGAPFAPSDLAQSVANNLGLKGEANVAMTLHLRDTLEAIGGSTPTLADLYDRGRALMAETVRFATQVDHPLYGEAARRFNAEIDAALKYATIAGTLNAPTNADGSPIEYSQEPSADLRVVGLAVGGVGDRVVLSDVEPTLPEDPPARYDVPEVRLIGLEFISQVETTL